MYYIEQSIFDYQLKYLREKWPLFFSFWLITDCTSSTQPSTTIKENEISSTLSGISSINVNAKYKREKKKKKEIEKERKKK